MASRFNKSAQRTTRGTTTTTPAGAPSAPAAPQTPAPDVSGDGSNSPAAATVEAAPGGDPSHVEREPQVASEGATATMTDEGNGSTDAPAADEQGASDEGKSKTKKRRLGRRKKGEEQHG